MILKCPNIFFIETSGSCYKYLYIVREFESMSFLRTPHRHFHCHLNESSVALSSFLYFPYCPIIIIFYMYVLVS